MSESAQANQRTNNNSNNNNSGNNCSNYNIRDDGTQSSDEAKMKD